MFDTAFFCGVILAFVLGTVVSKWLQAFVAYRLGDRTPRQEGRMSFRIGVQHDVLGLLLGLLLALKIPTFAWGKPLNLDGFNNRRKRFGVFLIGLSGPLGYFLVGLAGGLLLTALVSPAQLANYLDHSRIAANLFPIGPLENFFIETLFWFVTYNIFFAAIQLIPLYPLDGYFIFFKGLFPVRWETSVIWMETYGVTLLLAIVVFLPLMGISLTNFVAAPIVNGFFNMLGFRFSEL